MGWRSLRCELSSPSPRPSRGEGRGEGLSPRTRLVDRNRGWTPHPNPLPARAGRGSASTSPRRVLDQPPIEPDHVGIAFDGKALIGAVKTLQIFRIGAHRREAKNLVGDAGVVA